METIEAEPAGSPGETFSSFTGISRPDIRPQSRVTRTAAIAALIGLSTLSVAGILFAQSMGQSASEGPRVELEVSGLHCPIQCGLKVAAALESLPWVVPGSVTANPKTGRVTFAVTSRDAVDPGEVNRVVEHAGFPVRSIRN